MLIGEKLFSEEHGYFTVTTKSFSKDDKLDITGYNYVKSQAKTSSIQQYNQQLITADELASFDVKRSKRGTRTIDPCTPLFPRSMSKLANSSATYIHTQYVYTYAQRNMLNVELQKQCTLVCRAKSIIDFKSHSLHYPSYLRSKMRMRMTMMMTLQHYLLPRLP